LEAQDALFDLIEAGEVRRSQRVSGEDRVVDLDLVGAGSSRRRCDALARVQPFADPASAQG
jgi:hypothetical protein